MRSLAAITFRTTLYALASAALTACATASGDATLQQLRTRAAFDLNCPESDLHSVTLDDRTRGVRGCGQQATYVESCESVFRTSRYGSNDKDNCTWVLNTDSVRRGGSNDQAKKPSSSEEER